MRRRLNVKFLVVFLVGLTLASVGVHWLHGYQAKRNASSLLKHAERADADGRVAEANRFRERYLAYVPDDRDVLVKYGLALASDDRDTSPKALASALAALEKALLRDPDRSDARRKAARLAMDLNRLPEAREHLEILLRSTPDDGEAELLLGRCLESDGKFAEAATTYESARKHRPNLIEIYVRLADVLRTRSGDGAKADRVMDAVEVKDGVIARNGQSSRAYLERSRYRRTYQVSTSEITGDLAHALELDPDNADALLDSAGRQREVGRVNEARSLLARAVAKHPRDARIYIASSDLELEANRPEEAIAQLKRGDEMIPKNYDILWARAEILIQLHRHDEAKGVITLLGEVGYLRSLLDYLDARIDFDKGRWATAAEKLTTCQVALAEHSELASLERMAVFMLGRCYEQLGNPERQQTAFRRVIETTPKGALDPIWIPAHLEIAKAWTVMGRPDEAIEAYRRIETRSFEARVAAAKLLVARELRLAPEKRNWPPLELALNEAEAASPGSIDVAIQRAEILLAQGQAEPAWVVLKQARDRKPEVVEGWTALAALAARRGKPTEAATILDEGVRKLGDRVDFRLVRANLQLTGEGLKPAQSLNSLEMGLDALSVPDQQRLMIGLAQRYALIGDVQGAGRLLSKLAQQEPTNLAYRLQLFELAAQAKDEPGMVRLVNEMHRLEGEDGYLWRYGKSRLLILQARKAPAADRTLGEARSLLSAVAVRRPAWIKVPSTEAELDELEGKPEQAMDHYRRAIKLGERNALVLLKVIQLLFERQHYEEANQVLAMLREMNPRSTEIDRLESEIALRLNDVARALAMAEKCVAAKPEGAPEQLWLAQVLQVMATKADDQGQKPAAMNRRDEAIRSARRSITLDPVAPEARLTLVRLLTEAGRREEALTVSDQARRELRWEPTSILLADCYQASGRADLADQCYQAAFKANPTDLANLQAIVTSQLRANRTSEAVPGLRKIIDLKDRAPREAAWAQRTLAILLASRGAAKESLAVMGLVDDIGGDQAARSRAEASTDALRAEAFVRGAQPDRSMRRRAILSIEEMVARQVASTDDRFRLAQLLAADDEWAKARGLMQALLSSDGENPAYLEFYIEGLRRRGTLNEAKGWLNKLEQVRPNFPRTVELKARLAHDLGREDEVTATLLAYAAAHPEQTSSVGVLFEELGQLDKAEARYRDAATRTRQPEDVLPLAGFLARRGRLADSLAIYERSWRTCSPEVVSNSAVASLHSTSVDDAQCKRVAGWIEEALTKAPSSKSLRFDLANLRCLQGRYDDAEGIYRRVFEEDPKDGTALNNLAWMFATSGRKLDEALGHINHAIDIHGATPDLLDTRALVHIASGHGEDAVKDLEDALRGSSLAIMYYHRARARLMKDDRPGASTDLKKAVASGLKVEEMHPLERTAHHDLITALARP